MFESIIKKINYLVAKKLYLKNSNADALSFSNLIKNSSDFLLVMPEDETDFNYALELAEQLLNNKKQVTLFVRDFRVSQIHAKNKLQYIDFGITDISKLKLPSKRLIELLKEKKYDVVIDLNLSENIFFSIVPNLVNSKYRVGFRKENSDKFYNLQFSILENNSALSYKNLLNSLQMF